jgi:PRD1 phage membrane DNA delivery
MSDAIGSALVSIVMAVIGVAIIAVLVSKSAQTANVVSAGGTALSNVLGAALSPVTGSGLAGSVTRQILGTQ